MFCSDSPDLIISNKCSVINPTEKCRNTVAKRMFGGGKNQIKSALFLILVQQVIPHTHLIFSKILIYQKPNKIKQNPKFHPSNPLSHPISSKPTKIKHFAHFPTQKSNSHLAKNLPTIPKSSLFISTFIDNNFSSKNYKLYHLY